MTDPIANEAAFVAACKINPGIVKQGSVAITFIAGQPHLTFAAVVPLDWATLAEATTAAVATHDEDPSG